MANSDVTDSVNNGTSKYRESVLPLPVANSAGRILRLPVPRHYVVRADNTTAVCFCWSGPEAKTFLASEIFTNQEQQQLISTQRRYHHNQRTRLRNSFPSKPSPSYLITLSNPVWNYRMSMLRTKLTALWHLAGTTPWSSVMR